MDSSRKLKRTVSARIAEDDAHPQQLFGEPEIHTVLGNVHLILSVCGKSDLLSKLQSAFPQDKVHEHMPTHLRHSTMKD
jgi:hypothetical protein